MNESMSRYFKRSRVTLKCEVVTPMFLGNAHQEAEWRAAPFKALIRYWWRVTQHSQKSPEALLKEESTLFGSAGGMERENAGKSLLYVNVYSEAKPNQKAFKHTLNKIHHPETKETQVKPLLYLAGMGLMSTDETLKHSYFPPKSVFRLHLEYPGEIETDLQPTFALIQAFGALGARSRNGWGSFQMEPGLVSKESAVKSLNNSAKEWKNSFEKDYPNCLGSDEKGLLLWKTKYLPSWEEVMAKLADAYVKVRAGDSVKRIQKIDPDGKDDPSERHLLGFPLTHHMADAWNKRGWGSSARHASPLHFVVHRKANKYIGLILHLPHAHSKNMKLPTRVDQIKVWEKVHSNLDQVLDRAQYEDCL